MLKVPVGASSTLTSRSTWSFLSDFSVDTVTSLKKPVRNRAFRLSRILAEENRAFSATSSSRRITLSLVLRLPAIFTSSKKTGGPRLIMYVTFTRRPWGSNLVAGETSANA